MIEQSSGLFHLAATVANLPDRNCQYPRRQLKIMLTSTYVWVERGVSHRHLDALYLTVLREAFPKIGENDWQRANLRMILGSNCAALRSAGPGVPGCRCLSWTRARRGHASAAALHSLLYPDAMTALFD